GVPWFSLFASFKKLMVEKHILFSFNNPAAQQIFNVNNWGGTLLSLPEKEGQLGDFRMINEANLGVNKVNAFLKRQISDAITIDKEGSITGELTVRYANESTDNTLGGPYINYLRSFFPQGTTLTGVKLDGQEASMSGKQKIIDVEEATQSGKTSFGMLITVPVKSTKVVALSYKLPKAFPLLPGKNNYSYVFQKQPGT